MPKMGTVFPGRSNAYAFAVAGALRRELGETHRAVKTVMRWTGAGERTVKNWLSGQIGPSGMHLLALIRHSDAVLEVVLLSADRPPVIAALTVVQARAGLVEALARIDLLMANIDRP